MSKKQLSYWVELGIRGSYVQEHGVSALLQHHISYVESCKFGKSD